MNKLFPITVVPTETGEVVRQNPNKPDYGSIMLEQIAFTYRNNFLNKRRKVGFIVSNMEDLHEYVEVLNLKPGAELPGNLVVIEQYVPHYDEQKPKINPTNGNAVLVNGAMVYEQVYYDEGGTRFDEFLSGERTAGAKIAEPKLFEIMSQLTESSTLGK